MNIVIPMAGLGQRFANCGFPLPKPLIDVIGKPMYRHAVDCMPLKLATNLIFILQNNAFSLSLKNDIENNYGANYSCSVVVLEEPTQGQAETVLKSAPFLDLQKATLIHNCDTYITSGINWPAVLAKKIDGAIVTFNSAETRWSYAQLAADQQTIIDIQEKKVISVHASTGTYFFSDTNDLLANIQLTIKNNIRENNEYYLSTVYRLMLRQNKVIVPIPISVEDMLCFGTPYDLVNSINKMYSNTKNI